MSFLLCVVLQCDLLFQELELSLFSLFLLAMFGVKVSAVERRLFALPLWFSGMRTCNPVSLASRLFNSSVCGTKHLIRSIVGLETFVLDSHLIVSLLIS